MATLQFPDGFLWGAATSAHQVEGGNKNDWSEWEKKNAERLARESEKKFGHLPHWEKIKTQATNPQNYISGAAAEHYNRFRTDFDLAKQLGHNAHRFSIEWSRVEPEEGKFDEAAIEHYRQVLEALQERNLEPFVTLWHWTNPLWLADKGGPESKEFARYFARYAQFVVSRLKGRVRFWMTINEPTSVIGAAYYTGAWPPQKKSKLAALRVFHRLADAHIAGYGAIHEADPLAQVGFGNLLHSFSSYHKNSPFDYFLIFIARIFTNRYMLRLTKGYNDYLTVQYYHHNRFKFPRKIHLGDKPETDLGWEIFPEGLYSILEHLKRHKLPIYITENGLADANDQKRISFIKEHLRWTYRAIAKGADVRGYFYWSFLDNFEWDKGFWPRFGLVEVDYATQERKIRPSAKVYAAICRNNVLEVSDIKKNQ